MAEAAVLPLSSEAAGVISIARNILPRPTPSAPRRALLPGDHSFIFKGGLVDPRLRASNEHIPIVRVPRAGGRPGYPSHPSETAALHEHRRPSSLPSPALSNLARFSLLEGHPCWSKCGRRTRPFSGRAFREHRTNMGVLPSPLQLN